MMLFFLFSLWIISFCEEEEDLELDLCPLCVETLEKKVLDDLAIVIDDILADGAAAEGCYIIGNRLEQIYGKKVGLAAFLICDAVGFGVIMVMVYQNLEDPIYFCQKIKLCPVHDCNLTQCCELVSHDVEPSYYMNIGQKVQMDWNYYFFQSTGTGEARIEIETPSGSSPSKIEMTKVFPDGYTENTNRITFFLETTDTEKEKFGEGTYFITFTLCQGTCGSSKEHSKLLATDYQSFQLVNYTQTQI